MCFSPQWRALLRHLNIKQCRYAASFLRFRVTNVFCNTLACNFWAALSPQTSAPLLSPPFDPGAHSYWKTWNNKWRDSCVMRAHLSLSLSPSRHLFFSDISPDLLQLSTSRMCWLPAARWACAFLRACTFLQGKVWFSQVSAILSAPCRCYGLQCFFLWSQLGFRSFSRIAEPLLMTVLHSIAVQCDFQAYFDYIPIGWLKTIFPQRISKIDCSMRPSLRTNQIYSHMASLISFVYTALRLVGWIHCLTCITISNKNSKNTN